MSKFLLPPERSLLGLSDQGWQVKTKIATSKVAEGAGNGRFSEDVVPPDTRVMIKKLIPMSSVGNLVDLAGDMTITFASEEDLERFITQAASEGGHSREAVLNLYENFVWGLDDTRACLNMSTWSVNHGDGVCMGQVELNFEMVDGVECVVGIVFFAILKICRLSVDLLSISFKTETSPVFFLQVLH